MIAVPAHEGSLYRCHFAGKQRSALQCTIELPPACTNVDASRAALASCELVCACVRLQDTLRTYVTHKGSQPMLGV